MTGISTSNESNRDDSLPAKILDRLNQMEDRLTRELKELQDLRALIAPQKHGLPSPTNLTQLSTEPPLSEELRTVEELLARSETASTTEEWQELSNTLGEIAKRFQPRWQLEGRILPEHLSVDTVLASTVQSLSFSPDSASLYGTLKEGTCWHFSLDKVAGGQVASFDVRHDMPSRLERSTISADGTKLACATSGRFTVDLYSGICPDSKALPTPVAISSPNSRLINKIAFSPDGRVLAFLDEFGHAGLHLVAIDGATPEIVGFMEAPFASFKASHIAFSPDGSEVLIGWNGTGPESSAILDLLSLKNIEGRNGLPRLIDRKTFKEHLGLVCFGPEGQLVTSTRNQLFVGAPTPPGASTSKYNWQCAFTSNSAINAIAACSERDMFAFVDENDFLRIANLKEKWQGSELEIVAYKNCASGQSRGYEGCAVTGIAFSPCGRKLAVGYRSGKLQVIEGSAP
jgi:WD40 repeat protein